MMTPRGLLIDGIIFSLQRHGGISVYFRELLSRLARARIDVRLTLHGTLQQPSPEAIPLLRVDHRPGRMLERYRRCPTNGDTAVFHSSYYRRPNVASMPTVVTVHDFAYERLTGGPRRWVHSAQKFAAIRNAQSLICISDATRQDLLEYVGLRAGQHLQVIHNGVGDHFRPLSMQAADRPFVLFVGQRGRYKNFRLAVRALSLLHDLQLHCVGGGPFNAKEFEGAPESTVRRIHYLGTVDDDMLNRLYNQAVCLFYPSAYEGFGIPVVEAMRAGCPVIGTECKAVLEVGRHALRVVPADDPRAAADAIDTLRSDREGRARQVAAGLEVATGYSWDRTARQTLETYRALGLLP